MKRLFDLIASALGLIILMPLLLIIALLIKFDSKGPVFFRQERVGLRCKSFKIFKFRTMVIDADKQGPYFTAKNDSRITRVGKLLRKTSLDELPQFINVLLGDMSVVGPRPDVFEQVENYTIEEWEERHLVQPGITGLAQAKIRSNATVEQRKAYDLEYVRSRTFLMDIKIIFWTIKQVLFKGGY
ncbi:MULTISPECIES: sugar transferase [unclassified Brevibacillus]|uniref:sugar transferase n=1 Tax=unclassified Brevibacillus TaxID=2684853 RepID=UPI0035666DFC